jgi:hypothetical protein
MIQGVTASPGWKNPDSSRLSKFRQWHANAGVSPGKNSLRGNVRCAVTAFRPMLGPRGEDGLTPIEEPAATTAFKTKMVTAGAQQNGLV